jgi:5-methylcytosine-specific restriction endonuclease McrA
MAEACSKLKIHFNTFKRRAERLGIYRPNQGGRDTRKWVNGHPRKIPLEDILQGKHPQYQTFKLKNRLIEHGYIQAVCNACGLADSWNDRPLSLELDHIDGNSNNHRIENLQLLCPNCHSQTPTFRSKNRS